ncbi:hypothetical protein [Thermoflexus sp.]|uniref:hypothetical protein n=1 Tax=Thermoflexus sp. TaxID=1969742 RepID=UPI0026010A08|nr:hypothetical protein [Thermoflexus sp.]MCS6963378.1 hypothetical protein [Thermoflexus sp.]MCX7691113.1 hypothetical protein [Thermoflexus sp.]MDW8186160.1 hypothetical protein [Anaerolineae bacterium]
MTRLLDERPEGLRAPRQRLLSEELLRSPSILRRLSVRASKTQKGAEDLNQDVQRLARR